MIPEFIAFLTLALTTLAEWMHLRRIRRVASLAFGPAQQSREWTGIVPIVRTIAMTLLVWGLVTLFVLDPKVLKPKKRPEGGFRHLVIVLDVSPSMQLADAGPEGQQTRAKRAAEILMSILNRVALEQCRVSVVAFYSGAKPVVIDTSDPEVVRNILGDLPLDQAFTVGKTKILDGIKEACDLAKEWRAGSTTLILASDGDTVPDSGMPTLPPSIGQVLVIGVGDARLGKFIDGHQSRQDSSTLRQVATRLHGSYHDGNEKHLPSPSIAALAASLPMREEKETGRRELALIAVALGGAFIALLPVALALAGSRWEAGRQKNQPRHPAQVVKFGQSPAQFDLISGPR
ncbi:MAG: Ca-activated chloride channel [Verrucomicrobiota bacterium]|jgi:Ca-activated chloride channel family protein